jgi:hypothetical protein
MNGVDGPDGYILAPGRTPEDVLAMADELLRSEGIDPAWPALVEPPDEQGQPSA